MRSILNMRVLILTKLTKITKLTSKINFFFWHLTFSYVLKSYKVLNRKIQAEIIDEENPLRHGGGIEILNGENLSFWKESTF